MTALSWTRGQRSDQTAAHTAVIAQSQDWRDEETRTFANPKRKSNHHGSFSPGFSPQQTRSWKADLPRSASQTDSNCHRALAVGCSVCVAGESIAVALADILVSSNQPLST